MTELAFPSALPLALVQSATMVADTVVTISASPTGLQRWINLLTSIASGVIALALTAISIALIPAAWNSRKTYAKVSQLLDRIHDDLRPIVQHTRAAADNVNYITASIRTDVEAFKGTLHATQGRIDDAARMAEQRIGQLNALLEVVQEEAEHIFIDAASTLRGVRAGADALKRPVQRRGDDDGGEEIRELFRSRDDWEAGEP